LIREPYRWLPSLGRSSVRAVEIVAVVRVRPGMRSLAMPLAAFFHQAFPCDATVVVLPSFSFRRLERGLPPRKRSSTFDTKKGRDSNKESRPAIRILRLLRSQELAARRATVRSCLACTFIDRGPRDFLVLWRTSLRRMLAVVSGSVRTDTRLFGVSCQRGSANISV